MPSNYIYSSPSASPEPDEILSNRQGGVGDARAEASAEAHVPQAPDRDASTLQTPHSPVPARLRDVSLVYEGAQGSTRALNSVTLDVHAGEWLCILGANGSGKSTLAQVIAGLLAPDEGDVQLLGIDVTQDGRPDFQAYRDARRRIGIVFQNPDDQIVTSIVEEDVAFGPENLGLASPEIETRVRRELDRVAMSAHARTDPAHLSGGQRQRVTIASALAMQPEVLVLDEPTSQLDVRGRHALARAIGRLRESGTSIVHVTHDMEDALLADRVIVLDHGRIALEGRPQEVFAHHELVSGLNLEQPFAAQLAAQLAEQGLDVRWTLDTEELAAQVRDLVSASTAGNVSYSADDTAGEPGPSQQDASQPDATTQQQNPTIALLALSQVGFSYESAAAAREQALIDVDLSAFAGRSLAIIGQTGSGKSTIARLACALELPDTGSVHVLGTDTRERGALPRIRGRIGYVMQHPERQLFAQSVYEDVAYGPRNMGLSAQEVDHRVRESLRLVGLEDRADASPFELSGGQQRLAAIAGVLSMGPAILVLDEPMAGLDPKTRTKLSQLLDALKSAGTAVVEITHSMERAASADRIAFVNDGRIRMCSTPAEIFRHGDELVSCGLGIPAALDFAQRVPALSAAPLTTEELVACICEAVVAWR